MSCRRILLVEDDHAIRQMIKDVLEIQGYTVFTAANGAEGIQQLRELAAEPCVVLLDLMMPGTNGWQFLDFQRNNPQFQKIPVVVCSAYRESAKTVHPDAFIEKPVQLPALLGTVRQFCA
jgi:CheY-like chemotaxis protein